MEKIDERTGDKLIICDKCGEITHRWTKQGVIGKPHVHQCTK